MFWK
jgi:hypothetical protein